MEKMREEGEIGSEQVGEIGHGNLQRVEEDKEGDNIDWDLVDRLSYQQKANNDSIDSNFNNMSDLAFCHPPKGYQEHYEEEDDQMVEEGEEVTKGMAVQPTVDGVNTDMEMDWVGDNQGDEGDEYERDYEGGEYQTGDNDVREEEFHNGDEDVDYEGDFNYDEDDLLDEELKEAADPHTLEEGSKQIAQVSSGSKGKAIRKSERQMIRANGKAIGTAEMIDTAIRSKMPSTSVGGSAAATKKRTRTAMDETGRNKEEEMAEGG